MKDVEGKELPVIPVDDLIPAKAHALSLNPKLKQEIADLESIFESETEIDIPYVMGEFNQLELTLPSTLQGKVPEELTKYIK